MVHEKTHEMVDSFERSIRAQGLDPEQYYELAGTDHAEFEERVSPDAVDTVKKELVLDAVASAEGIVADEEKVMHEIGHLAEDSERTPEEIADLMRTSGTYSMLEEEISRQKALDFLVENATPVPMPEQEEEELAEEEESEGSVEGPVEATAVATEKDEREEQK
jgi:trigger factor